jgi:molybdopterin converting factor small subunit
LPEGATVEDLFQHLTADDDTASILKQTRPFINGQQADRASTLQDGAEVIFMRPIAGG